MHKLDNLDLTAKLVLAVVTGAAIYLIAVPLAMLLFAAFRGPADYLPFEPGARWITHVGVAEDSRGLGVGGYLFSRALDDYWREHPDQELRLTVIPYNTPAIRLYRRTGFIQVDEPGDEPDELTMVRSLHT